MSDRGNRPHQRKAFTAEIQRLRSMGMAEPAAAPAGADIRGSGTGVPSGGGGDGALRAEVHALRDELKALHALMRAHFEPPEDEGADVAEPAEHPVEAEYRRLKDEVAILKTELRALANSIQDTKREIAALRTHDEDTDRLLAVTSELDAVVGATEGATDGILDMAERIDTIAHTMKSAGDVYIGGLADDIIEHVLAIFESCNFQDITGQRITKVVNTLKFVEDRIDRMIDIWGSDAFESMTSGDSTPDEDRRLLNGPQLADAGISQDEIDKLFD